MSHRCTCVTGVGAWHWCTCVTWHQCDRQLCRMTADRYMYAQQLYEKCTHTVHGLVELSALQQHPLFHDWLTDSPGNFTFYCVYIILCHLLQPTQVIVNDIHISYSYCPAAFSLIVYLTCYPRGVEQEREQPLFTCTEAAWQHLETLGNTSHFHKRTQYTECDRLL